jgi:hypothetical protein
MPRLALLMLCAAYLLPGVDRTRSMAQCRSSRRSARWRPWRKPEPSWWTPRVWAAWCCDAALVSSLAGALGFIIADHVAWLVDAALAARLALHAVLLAGNAGPGLGTPPFTWRAPRPHSRCPSPLGAKPIPSPTPEPWRMVPSWPSWPRWDCCNSVTKRLRNWRSSVAVSTAVLYSLAAAPFRHWQPRVAALRSAAVDVRQRGTQPWRWRWGLGSARWSAARSQLRPGASRFVHPGLLAALIASAGTRTARWCSAPGIGARQPLSVSTDLPGHSETVGCGSSGRSWPMALVDAVAMAAATLILPPHVGAGW